ncbi:mucin-binding protein, partial [Weissella confusa]
MKYLKKTSALIMLFNLLFAIITPSISANNILPNNPLSEFSKSHIIDLTKNNNMDASYSPIPQFGPDSSVSIYIHGQLLSAKQQNIDPRSGNLILPTESLGNDTYAYVKNALYRWDDNKNSLKAYDMKVYLISQDITDNGTTNITFGFNNKNFLAVGNGNQVSEDGNYVHMKYQFIDPVTGNPVAQKIHVGYQDIDFNESIRLENSVVNSVFLNTNSKLPYYLDDSNHLIVTHDYNDSSDKNDTPQTPDHMIEFHLDVPAEGMNIDISTSRNTPDMYHGGSQVYPSNINNLSYIGYQSTHFVDTEGKELIPSEYQEGLSGTDWNTSSKIIPGYTLVPEKIQGANQGKYKNGINDIVIYVYQKTAPTVTTEKKTVKENIDYFYDNGDKAADSHTVSVDFTRQVSIDPVTGEKSYGDWSADQSFDAVKSPNITGYTPDHAEIDKQLVKGSSDDMTFKVVYKKKAPTITPGNVHNNGSFVSPVPEQQTLPNS